MKRLTPLPEHERCHVVGFVDTMSEGFWWCKRCLHVTELEHVTDPADESRQWDRCGRCGASHFNLQWHEPIFSDVPSKIFKP